MPLLHIPPLMRDLTKGEAQVRVPGQTVAEAIAALDATYPGARARLCEGDRLAPGLAVAVDGRRAALGLREPLGEDSEVRFLPAVAGG